MASCQAGGDDVEVLMVNVKLNAVTKSNFNVMLAKNGVDGSAKAGTSAERLVIPPRVQSTTSLICLTTASKLSSSERICAAI